MILGDVQTQTLAVIGGISTAAAATAAIWKFIKWIGKASTVMTAMQDVVEIAGIQGALTELAADVKSIKTQAGVQESVDRLADEVAASQSVLGRMLIESAIVAFQAHTDMCPVPSYVIATSDDKRGEFIWANAAWYEFHGLDYTQAINGQYWESIHPKDRLRVKAASDSVAIHWTQFKVEYTHVNQRTGQETPTLLISRPLVPYNGKPGDRVCFLGSMRPLTPADRE